MAAGAEEEVGKDLAGAEDELVHVHRAAHIDLPDPVGDDKCPALDDPLRRPAVAPARYGPHVRIHLRDVDPQVLDVGYRSQHLRALLRLVAGSAAIAAQAGLDPTHRQEPVDIRHRPVLH